MTTVIGGSSPSVTFSDGTTQSTAANPATPTTAGTLKGVISNSNTTTGVGYQALNSNTASNNTAVGYQAGYSNTTGAYNVFLGYQSGYTSNYNGNSAHTCVGQSTGYSLTTGLQNTFIGSSSGYYLTTGSKNTILGSFTGNQGGLDIRTTNNYIVLSDGDGNPRGVFDNNGNFFIGQTSVNLQNANSWWQAAGQTYWSHASGSASGSGYCIFGYNGSAIGSIVQSGTTAVLYNTTSDYRLKENVQPITTGLATITALNPVNFDWISDKRSDTGFLAHEFQAVIPNAVVGTKDAVDAEGKPVYQQMDNSGAVPYLVAAIKELNATIVSLEAQLHTAGVQGF